MNLRRPRRSSFAEPITKTLEWDVVLRPVTVDGNILDNYQSLVRNDTGTVLSVTKKSYQPATNEKFKEIVSKIHEFTGFDVQGYSVFQEGRKILAFLKNNEKMKIGDFDSENYMVIGNSFDCSTGFFTGISNVFLRCTNQFSRIGVGHSIRHNSQLNLKLDELVQFYKGYVQHENQLKRSFESWNKAVVTQATINNFV